MTRSLAQPAGRSRP